MMKTCTQCKKEKELLCFVGNKGQETKMCGRCRDMKKKNRENNICEHNRNKYYCKECKGTGICKHNKQKSCCKECGGSSICEHNKYKQYCIECGGASICKHNRRKRTCRECGGNVFCKHNKNKYRCIECGGGSMCKHNRRASRCKECKGGETCEHNKIRSVCKICNPLGHLAMNVRLRVLTALKENKSKSSVEYLGCTIEEYKKFLEDKFVEGMTWENQGEWHIDHIIPVFYENPTLEEVIERLHYTNTQPLWAKENMSKGNRYIG